MTSFEGRVIAITGAASGIALATARLLASRGASLSLADVRQDPLDAAVADLQKCAPNVKIYAKTLDVRNGKEVGDWLDETIKHLGPLTGAANLAGVLSLEKNIVDSTDEDWDFTMDVNLKGVFNCIRAELQKMDKDASIVTTSSVAGLRGYPGGAAYSTSKHAIIGLTRSAALEAGPRTIRVNCIAPGPIDTPMVARLRDQVGVAADLAFKRMGTPDEVAKLIAFLLSDESTYTTGSCYTIDGGWTA